VFIWEVEPDLIDILFFIHNLHDLEYITLLELSPSDPAIIPPIDLIEYSMNDCIRISILELWSRLKEL
jgi:hypothetical protein